MSKKGWIIIGLYVIIFLIAVVVIFGNKLFPPKKVHYHAGFVVIQDDKKLDFSDFKYMKVNPCTTEEDHAAEDEQLEKAHLHDGVGDVVHMHRENAKWKDLFTNMKYQMDYSKVTAYINGQKVTDFANQPIQSYDSVVIFVGDIDESHLKEAVEKDYIKEKEKKSENCGT